jgi:hypothetical protein
MKKILNSNFLAIPVLIFALAILLIANLTFAVTRDLTVTQATDLNGGNATVGTPFNLIFTISNKYDTSVFSASTTIFSTALASKTNFGTPAVSKSGAVLGDIECKINGIFKKSLDCRAKGSVSIPADETVTVTVKVTPTAIGTFVNPRIDNKTFCKVDYTSSINGDVLESNESNNDCTPQALSVTVGDMAPGNNLVLNPSVETVDPNNSSFPQNWISSSWGNNTTIFTYPVPGFNSPKALGIEVSNYTSGDARWEFTEIPVKPLERYAFSDWYKSDTTTYPIVRFTLNDGSYFYFALRAASPSADWKQFSESFSVPFTAKTMSVSHTIKSVGSLTLDNYSLVKIPQ